MPRVTPDFSTVRLRYPVGWSSVISVLKRAPVEYERAQRKGSTMPQYLLRVRPHDGEYRATLRELAACVRPDAVPAGPIVGTGCGSTAPAAIVAAVAAASIPDVTLEPARRFTP